LVCTAVVNGLNNFQVGFPTALPTAGAAVDMNSYTVCGTRIVGVTLGFEVTITCAASTELHRYVIIQSRDTSAEALCIAEVCVNAPSQYAITFVLVQQQRCIQRLSLLGDRL